MILPEEFQFTKEFEVGSFQVHPNGNICLTSLADLLQEIAWRHADSGDFGRNLMETQQMWVLSRLEIKVQKFPKWGDKIRIFTGGRGTEKLFAFREFLIWNEKEEVLARAMSSWLLLHSETKKILRPEIVLPAELFDPSKKPDWQPGKISLSGELISEEKIQVRNSDLDLYHHVNNTSYIRWVENALAAQDWFPQEISINYLAECLSGDQVELKLFKDEEFGFLEGKVGDRMVFSAKVKLDNS
ncbi:acyl-ACP thioesterase [Algoriphagus boseongensis]|uniref:Acyl-ACP thioesterase n=1 Tax=Algoriphagus boseongensis TaxID=1442587 RepID=A0A4R6T8D0_9BACT|nr:acyl-ACP thioesterase domain-containing protein [Algoriphagus boseongensis]TDQ18469.1 acyl-ACP thioesterase [Algoriphagus boseongensis]